MKRFVFGRPQHDPKGPDEEKGEIVIEAPSLSEARLRFAEAVGVKSPRYEQGPDGKSTGRIVPDCADKRIDIVRVANVADIAKPKRGGKR